jgi:hypothetical protein
MSTKTEFAISATTSLPAILRDPREEQLTTNLGPATPAGGGTSDPDVFRDRHAAISDKKTGGIAKPLSVDTTDPHRAGTRGRAGAEDASFFGPLPASLNPRPYPRANWGKAQLFRAILVAATLPRCLTGRYGWGRGTPDIGLLNGATLANT